MNAMRLALLFGRTDVDEFLADLDHDAYEEWIAFIQLEPQGWQAERIGIQRLSFMQAQTHSAKRLKERDYAINIGGKVRSDEAERARWEAMSVRTALAQELEGSGEEEH